MEIYDRGAGGEYKEGGRSGRAGERSLYIWKNLRGTSYFSRVVVCCQLAYINLRSAFFFV